MGLAILAAALTVLWIGGGIVTMPRDANEDQRTLRDAAVFFAGAMLAVETVVFFVGRSLSRSGPNGVTKRTERRARRRRWLLAPYLLASVGLGALAAFLPRDVWQRLEPLGLLVCQPNILVQFIGGGLLNIKLTGGQMQYAVTAAANLLYFPILFYPLYRILTMDRKAQAAACSRMKLILALLLGAHILIALFLLVASRA